MREKGQTTVQMYIIIGLVVVTLVGSWAAFYRAGTAKGATKEEVESAVTSAVGKEVTRTDVVSYLSDEAGSWSAAEPILADAGISAPTGEGEFPLSTPDEEFNVPLVCHGGEGNPFWNTVEYGYQVAKSMFPVKGTMYRPTTEYEPVWQVDTLETLSGKPKVDMVATTLPHHTMFDDVVKGLESKDKTVIAINTDDPTKNARSAYIGQEGYTAAYNMGKATWNKYYPEVFGHKPNPDEVKIIMPEGAPGAEWCGERIKGFKDFLEEKGVDVDTQVYEYDTEMSPEAQKPLAMSAIEENPDATMVLACQTAGGWYLAMDEMGMDPDDLCVVAHDLIPTLVEGIEKGYIEATVDQQPFLQGFYPVVEAYFHEMIKMTVYDINTGGAQIDSDTVGTATEFPKVIG